MIGKAGGLGGKFPEVGRFCMMDLKTNAKRKMEMQSMMLDKVEIGRAHV